MSNAIPVDSPAEARNHVISFLLRRTEENLLLKLSWDDLTKDIRHVLEKASGKKLCNWEYDPEYRILKVKARVSPLHAAFNACISRFIIDAVSTTLTRAEARCLVLNPKPVCLSRTPEISPGHKPAAWWKHPDCMIYFGERGGTKEFLRIVVEVGLSESYCDLVRDASQWLLRVRSASQPELVIIAKINEDKDQLDSHQKTQQFENTRNQLIAKYGDEMSQATHDIGSTPAGIQASSPSLLEAIGSEVVESDWVGQISAFVEVWVLRGGQPTQREARIDVLPTPANPRNLVLKITDLIPEERRSLFPNFDASRTLTMDMEFFRHDLDMARRETAFNRALEVIRPLDKDESNPEYLPWAIS